MSCPTPSYGGLHKLRVGLTKGVVYSAPFMINWGFTDCTFLDKSKLYFLYRLSGYISYVIIIL